LFRIILFLLLFSCAAYAGDKGTFSLVAENDIFHSDRYYTNGIKASWLSPPNGGNSLARQVAHLFPFFPEEYIVRSSFSVGQNMYTPTSITDDNPPDGDRPYAGWLYGSAGLIAENGTRLDRLELTLGVVGPMSLAEGSQKTVHKLIGSDHPNGWRNQLKNEPGLILAYQRSWRGIVAGDCLGFRFDVTPHIGGAAGNVFTYADTGFMVRWGQQPDLDYGPPRIQPSMPGSGYFAPDDRLRWYVFAGVDGRAVARNIFIEGNTLRDSVGTDMKPFVMDVQFGAVGSWKNYRLGYTQVMRSREFDEQGSRYQSFGAISFSVQM
jgi:hypothetical protein